MPTIEDVARAAGVSTATVSRALSGAPRISQATRSHVLEVVAELGYAPNLAAKTLRTTRTSKILVTVPNIANPFFARVLRSIELEAHNAGYAVLLGDTRGEESRENAFGAMLLRREADGIIVLGHRLPAPLLDLIAKDEGGAPVVNACGIAQPGLTGANVDNIAAARDALESIYAFGHVEVGVLAGSLRSPVSDHRLEGATQAAVAAGRESGLYLMRDTITNEAGYQMALDLLRRRPGVTALFCASDELALGALAAVRAAGLRCPEDVSVVGFDNLDYAPFLSPSLSTVGQPMNEMGRCAVQLLLDILSGQATAVRQLVLPTRLIMRESLAPPSGR